jgi:hypothetical protein
MGLIFAERRSTRIKHDGRTSLEKVKENKKRKTLMKTTTKVRTKRAQKSQVLSIYCMLQKLLVLT